MIETTEKKRPTQSVKTFTHRFGHTVRLPNERVARIFERTAMNMMVAENERLLTAPQIVRRSRSDDAVRLFYAFYPETIVGGKWLCVVVKYLLSDAFVVTAYLTDHPKSGAPLWPTS